MIQSDEVIPLILVAMPSFEARWHEIESENRDAEGRLDYMDAGDVVRHLLTLLERGDTTEVRAGFQVIERLITEGDEYVQNLGVIGYLEGVQNNASHNELISAEAFMPFLGPESIRWWRGLNALWAGEMPPPVRPLDDPYGEP